MLRWPKGYKLSSCPLGEGLGEERKAWEHLRGKRSWGHALVPDARHHCLRKTGVVAVEVRHSGYGAGQERLWLVAARSGKGREPWYLLTNQPVETLEQAWRVVFAYARRWQIETSFRFQKSELALHWRCKARACGVGSDASNC